MDLESGSLFQDGEGEGVDNMDSGFGESESNVSLGGYGASHWESDSVSFSAYGAESDVSVDGESYVGREMFNVLDDGRYGSSDTDIDPMRAGLDQWDFSDEGGGDWEGANSDENLVEDRSPSERNGSSYWLTSLQPPENEIQESPSFIPDIIADLEESSTVRNSSDYFYATRFQLFQELTDSSTTGAPPAAVSFRDSLPRVLITEEQQKHGGLVCAICKDHLLIGTEVNQLPCMHFYHPCCIFTWLRARNSCPLCRFELPTDDKDYEERKQNSRARVEIHVVQQDDTSGDSADNISNPEADEACEFNNGTSEEGVNGDCATGSSSRGRTRGGWFFIAATPIVSLIALVIWLRNPRLGGRGPRGHRQFCEQSEHQLSLPAWGSSRFILGTDRNRRWWSIY